jgi:hypothetical protein
VKPALRDDAGHVTVTTLVLVPALLLVAALVLDAGLALSSKTKALDVAQAAARAGAQHLDLAAYRGSGTVRVDPGRAWGVGRRPRLAGVGRDDRRGHRHRSVGDGHRTHDPPHPASSTRGRPRVAHVRLRYRDRPTWCVRTGSVRVFVRGALVVAGRLLHAAAAIVVLVGMLVGIPWFLVAVMGWPLPDHWPNLAEAGGWLVTGYDIEFVLDVLTVGCWIFWVRFAGIVAVEFVLAVHEAIRYGRRRIPTRPGVHAVAAVLVAAVVGTLLLDLVRGLTAPGGSGPARPVSLATVTAAPDGGRSAGSSGDGLVVAVAARTTTGAPTGLAARRSMAPAGVQIALATAGTEPPWVAAARADGQEIHLVCAEDNLWNIARDRLGNPQRWREIYLLNRDKPQPNGFVLRDPDQIDVGWLLALPATDNAITPPRFTPGPPGAASDDESETFGTAGSAPANAAPSGPASVAPDAPASAAPTSPAPGSSTSAASGTATNGPDRQDASDERGTGVTLPSQGWISLGLAATIAATAAVLRLHRRRRARLHHPIGLGTGPAPSPVPEELKAAEVAGRRVLEPHECDPPGSESSDQQDATAAGRTSTNLDGHRPTEPLVPAPIGVDAIGSEVSLFDLPGTGIALHGNGVDSAARGLLAAVLATGAVPATVDARPVVVTTEGVLARLLPDGAPLVGLDPDGSSFDG